MLPIRQGHGRGLYPGTHAQPSKNSDGRYPSRHAGFVQIAIPRMIRQPIRASEESSWREGNRRVSNGDQVNRVAALAMKRGKSVDFTGYWQRHIAD